jgi:hypothetical protein
VATIARLKRREGRWEVRSFSPLVKRAPCEVGTSALRGDMPPIDSHPWNFRLWSMLLVRRMSDEWPFCAQTRRTYPSGVDVKRT